MSGFERVFVLLAAAVPTAMDMAGAAETSRPVSTYSIVARDPDTGELGVAVQSHWFSVGSVVPWAEAGVGAVATQSFVEPSYGPLGLEAMRRGTSAPAALAQLLAKDDQRELRQVAMVDSLGRVGVHTGGKCIPFAGHRTGPGYSVQANLMLTDEVPDAMARAYESARGALAERLLAALEAAQAVGGDIRGKQSAALLVVRATPTKKPWTDRLVDLRVEDSDRPLEELRRLLALHRAYERMNRGDEMVAAGKIEEAMAHYQAAEEMFPGNDEFVFWHAVTVASAGRIEEALPLFGRAFRMNPAWMLLVPRLPAVGQLPETPGLVEKILGAGPKPFPPNPSP
jgi:uncharacterized Ntn-hydrolase superfamily protein